MLPPVDKNPFSSRELWKSQEKLQEEINMLDENWFPENTKFNIYNQPSYKKPLPNREDASRPIQ